VKVSTKLIIVVGAISIMVACLALIGTTPSVEGFLTITGVDPHVITGVDPHIITGVDPHAIAGF
jgi:hypothetical protein